MAYRYVIFYFLFLGLPSLYGKDLAEDVYSLSPNLRGHMRGNSAPEVSITYEKASWLTWEGLVKANKQKRGEKERREILKEFARAIACTYKTVLPPRLCCEEIITKIWKIQIPPQQRINENLKSLMLSFSHLYHDEIEELLSGKLSLPRKYRPIPLCIYSETLKTLGIDLNKIEAKNASSKEQDAQPNLSERGTAKTTDSSPKKRKGRALSSPSKKQRTSKLSVAPAVEKEKAKKEQTIESFKGLEIPITIEEYTPSNLFLNVLNLSSEKREEDQWVPSSLTNIGALLEEVSILRDEEINWESVFNRTY